MTASLIPQPASIGIRDADPWIMQSGIQIATSHQVRRGERRAIDRFDRAAAVIDGWRDALAAGCRWDA